jgi:hypothetical protein
MMRKIQLIIGLLFSVHHNSNAQVQEQLTPVELKQKTVVTEPQTLYKGFFRAGLAMNYNVLNKIFTAEKKRESLASNIWANSWFIQTFFMYGISDRIQVELNIPYRFLHIYQSYRYEAPDIDYVGVQKWNTKGTGLSDLTASIAYQLVTEDLNKPSQTIYLYGIIPTGEKNFSNIKNEREFDRPVGAGEASVNVLYRLRKINYPLAYSVYLSYQYFFGGKKLLDPLDTKERSFQSGSNYSVGGNLFFHLNEWIAFRNSFDYFYSLRDEYDGVKEPDDSWVLQYYPGLSFQVKQFRIDQAVNVPLIGKLTSADPSYLLVLSYMF